MAQRPFSITDGDTVLVQPYGGINSPVLALLVTGTTVTLTQQLDPNDQFLSLSNTGLIAGTDSGGVFVEDDVAYSKTRVTTIAGDTSYPTGINKSGFVVGMSTSPTTQSYAWTWSNGTFTKFSYPHSSESTLNAVSDSGNLAGTFFTENLHTAYRAFAIVKGHSREISVPGCVDPLPSAINNDGLVVGSAVVANSRTHGQEVGFVSRPDCDVTTIDYKPYAPKTVQGPSGPVPIGSQFQTEVYGINKTGKLVGMFTGTYTTADGTWSQTIYIPFIGSPK